MIRLLTTREFYVSRSRVRQRTIATITMPAANAKAPARNIVEAKTNRIR
jgi:hypothetical protein